MNKSVRNKERIGRIRRTPEQIIDVDYVITVTTPCNCYLGMLVGFVKSVFRFFCGGTQGPETPTTNQQQQSQGTQSQHHYPPQTVPGPHRPPKVQFTFSGIVEGSADF